MQRDIMEGHPDPSSCPYPVLEVNYDNFGAGYGDPLRWQRKRKRERNMVSSKLDSRTVKANFGTSKNGSGGSGEKDKEKAVEQALSF